MHVTRLVSKRSKGRTLKTTNAVKKNRSRVGTNKQMTKSATLNITSRFIVKTEMRRRKEKEKKIRKVKKKMKRQKLLKRKRKRRRTMTSKNGKWSIQHTFGMPRLLDFWHI